MIIESELWKEELVNTANKLLKRMVQKRWSKRSWFCLEKEIFIGFYAVRKLIESNHTPKEFDQRNFKLTLMTSIGLCLITTKVVCKNLSM